MLNWRGEIDLQGAGYQYRQRILGLRFAAATLRTRGLSRSTRPITTTPRPSNRNAPLEALCSFAMSDPPAPKFLRCDNANSSDAHFSCRAHAPYAVLYLRSIFASIRNWYEVLSPGGQQSAPAPVSIDGP